MERVLKHFNVDTDPIFPNWFRKGVRLLAFKFFPFIRTVVSFIVIVWVLTKIDTKYGIEKMLAVGIAMVVMSLRGLTKLTNEVWGGE